MKDARHRAYVDEEVRLNGAEIFFIFVEGLKFTVM
jgi:hypothetical protein